MTPRIRIWYSPGACSFAPIVLLKEASLPFEPILTQVGQFTPEFKQLNPKSRVPVLALENEVITEIPAVLTAIAQLVPERKFLGATPLETVRVYEWLNWLSGTLHGQAFGGFWRPERFTDDTSPAVVGGLREKAVGNIKAGYGFIEERLAGREFAVGSALTVVDPFLLVFYRWASRVEGVDMKRDYPGYAAYAERLLQREAVQEAIKARL